MLKIHDCAPGSEEPEVRRKRKRKNKNNTTYVIVMAQAAGRVTTEKNHDAVVMASNDEKLDADDRNDNREWRMMASQSEIVHRGGWLYERAAGASGVVALVLLNGGSDCHGRGHASSSSPPPASTWAWAWAWAWASGSSSSSSPPS